MNLISPQLSEGKFDCIEGCGASQHARGYLNGSSPQTTHSLSLSQKNHYLVKRRQLERQYDFYFGKNLKETFKDLQT